MAKPVSGVRFGEGGFSDANMWFLAILRMFWVWFSDYPDALKLV